MLLEEKGIMRMKKNETFAYKKDEPRIIGYKPKILDISR